MSCLVQDQHWTDADLESVLFHNCTDSSVCVLVRRKLKPVDFWEWKIVLLCSNYIQGACLINGI